MREDLRASISRTGCCAFTGSWRSRSNGTGKKFNLLPRVRVFSDFHCVTRWSRLGNIWEGVATRDLLSRAGGPLPEAAYVLAHGYDEEFTTNLPLADFLAEDALVAITH